MFLCIIHSCKISASVLLAAIVSIQVGAQFLPSPDILDPVTEEEGLRPLIDSCLSLALFDQRFHFAGTSSDVFIQLIALLPLCPPTLMQANANSNFTVQTDLPQCYVSEGQRENHILLFGEYLLTQQCCYNQKG